MFYEIPSINRLAEDNKKTKLICTDNQLLFSKSLEFFKGTFISTSSIINMKQWTASVDGLPGYLPDISEDKRIKIPGMSDFASLLMTQPSENK